MALAIALVPGGPEAVVLGSAAAAEAAEPAGTMGTTTVGAEAPAAVSEGDALTEADRTGKNVEATSLRGESSEVFATPEGNLEAREYLRPVWTRKAGGEWQPVDTALAKSENGTVGPKATTVGLAFSRGGDGPLVRMERAGRTLALTWPTELPEPDLAGETATYPEVLPGVDLRMEAQVDGFTQLLVVKSAEAATNPQLAELRLGMAAEGMDVREADAGGLEAVDHGATSRVFEAPTPLMWDSSPGGTEVRGTEEREAPQATKTRILPTTRTAKTEVESGAPTKTAMTGLETSPTLPRRVARDTAAGGPPQESPSSRQSSVRRSSSRDTVFRLTRNCRICSRGWTVIRNSLRRGLSGSVGSLPVRAPSAMRPNNSGGSTSKHTGTSSKSSASGTRSTA